MASEIKNSEMQLNIIENKTQYTACLQDSSINWIVFGLKGTKNITHTILAKIKCWFLCK